MEMLLAYADNIVVTEKTQEKVNKSMMKMIKALA